MFNLLIQNKTDESDLKFLKIVKKWKTCPNVQFHYKFLEYYHNKPYMIPIYGIYESPCFLLIVQKYLPLKNLHQLIYLEQFSQQKNLFTESQTFNIARQLLKVIEEAHRTNKTILTIFPSKVFVNPEGNVYLQHLSLNKLDLMNLNKNFIWLDLQYNLKKVFPDEPIKPHWDFWCLGVLIYECLFGFHPFLKYHKDDIKALMTDGPFFFIPEQYKKISENC